MGVPHTVIDVILVNGRSVDFKYIVQHQDDISVYPVCEPFDVSELKRLCPKPPRNPSFILDVHLEKLAKYLRLLGFDAAYENNLTDENIIERSKQEHRIVLTRDIGILKNKKITYGHWMHNTNPEKQVTEILNQYHLFSLCHPFTRYLACNGLLKEIEKSKILNQIPLLTNHYYDFFKQCQSCQKIYWEGSHYNRLKNWIKKIVLLGEKAGKKGIK
ncbi:Uncharacterized conserved protein [Legionella wadsworthii]|uniref:Uncharacterized conserved protein n=1 Tax=Legionella wadsworthii TaxID=28088 RepID=A0A378LZ27_9GAMM|nr:Uncharacterized conserved protein [Legionella wadsworthii]